MGRLGVGEPLLECAVGLFKSGLRVGFGCELRSQFLLDFCARRSAAAAVSTA